MADCEKLKQENFENEYNHKLIISSEIFEQYSKYFLEYFNEHNININLNSNWKLMYNKQKICEKLNSNSPFKDNKNLEEKLLKKNKLEDNELKDNELEEKLLEDDFQDEIKRYFLYEYSDDIRLLNDSPQYPSLINYVKTGILTEKEMIEAILKM